jgi:hypothetical protein
MRRRGSSGAAVGKMTMEADVAARGVRKKKSTMVYSMTLKT